MSANAINLTLRLSPLLPNQPGLSASHSDDWLDNNDAGIFSDIEQQDAKPALNKVLENISLDANRRLIKVTKLEIQQNVQGFTIQHEGRATLLSDGDVVALGEHYLQVQIVKQAIVSNPIPSTPIEARTQHFDDIWQMDLPAAQTAPHHRSADPYAGALLPSAPTHSHDPLNFLYSQSQPRETYPSMHAPTSSYDRGPALDSALSILPSSSSLNIDSHSDYTPAPTPAESVRRDEYRNNYVNDNAGNVLRDLGINDNPLTLGNSVGSKQAPLTQQAPLDMIDELLYDDHDETLRGSPYPASYQRPYQTYALPPAQSNPAPQTSAWQSFKKKLFG